MNSTHYKLISKSKATDAFTFVELLVVTATLGVLAMMLLPALAKTSPNIQAVQCLNNLRQIQHGWLVYSTDNNDRIVPTVGQGALQVSLLPSPYTDPGNPENQWIYGDVTQPAAAANVNLLKLGLIFPYVPNVALFKCPADPRTQFYPPQAVASGSLSIRSISCNGYMSPIVDNIQTSTAPLNSNYRIFRKQSDLAVIGSANCWVMLDENPYSINDGWFVADPSPTASIWLDKPAAYHNNSCGLSFADGHCELKHWRDSGLIGYKLATGAAQYNPISTYLDDLHWLGQRTSVHK